MSQKRYRDVGVAVVWIVVASEPVFKTSSLFERDVFKFRNLSMKALFTKIQLIVLSMSQGEGLRNPRVSLNEEGGISIRRRFGVVGFVECNLSLILAIHF